MPKKKRKKKRLSSKMKWFVAIGILINVLLVGGIYVNYRLDQVVSSLNRPGLLFADSQTEGEGDEPGGVAQQIDNGDYWNGHWNDGRTPGGDGAGSGDGSGATVEPPSNQQIANDVAAQIGRPIDKADMIKAGLIILRRLNSEEISYIYQVGRKGSMTADEKAAVKKILSAKLTDEDKVTLKALGLKYGKNLTVLD
jgi:hypothetical protein